MDLPADFTGKVALVVGGGRGIGSAVVEQFARRGATVVVADTDRLPSHFNHYESTQVTGYADAQKLAARMTESGLRVTAAQADATDEDDIRRLYADLAEDAGRLDAVVNAFGVTHVCPVERMELAEFQQVVSGNLDGVFLSAKHALPLLRSSGGGAIVNFSSVSGRSGFAKVAHYCAAKFGVVGFTAALAQEVARDGIRVNAVCPGIVRSNMWRYLLSEFVRPGESEEECWERMRTMIPQREFQTPEDLAELVAYLAAATKVTGQAISVDGGMTAP
ncbi:SDR family NAD(P)-dependent oxidoreductase [Streptomyces sp. HNM0574]|uniref:SDR family NAD(P)-dependent oxidoreductase n=1 Tax=Streptomyces sp. HNM0574 TaxID=2714954 RepID=UPI0019D0F7FB|nr:SDR family NAD(P)-dependent oxidoreductase [Streptomyces sp. HNM0574]